MIRSARLRVRWLLAREGVAIALALVLVGALALGGAGWLATHPPTTEVTDHTHRETIDANLSTRAAVAPNATLYDPGQTLTNEPVYLRSETPSPTLVLTTTVPSGERVTVSQRLVATYTARRDGRQFWQDSTTLARTETTTRSGRVRTTTGLDLQALQRRTSELRATVGDAGSVGVTLRFVVTYHTPRYDGTIRKPIDFGVGDGWYQIPPTTASRTHSVPVTRSVAVPGGNRGADVGLGAAGVLALLLGAASAVVWRVESRRTDPAALAVAVHRARYAEWISTGRLPDDAGETTVAIDSLEGLVDVAIDAGARVVHDPARGRYAVLDGSTVYYYDR